MRLSQKKKNPERAGINGFLWFFIVEEINNNHYFKFGEVQVRNNKDNEFSDFFEIS